MWFHDPRSTPTVDAGILTQSEGPAEGSSTLKTTAFLVTVWVPDVWQHPTPSSSAHVSITVHPQSPIIAITSALTTSSGLIHASNVMVSPAKSSGCSGLTTTLVPLPSK